MTSAVSDCGVILFAYVHKSSESLQVSATITICEGFLWLLNVQGWIILTDSLSGLPCSLISVVAVKIVMGFLDGEIWCRYPDMKFTHLVETRKGKFMDSSGNFYMLLINYKYSL